MTTDDRRARFRSLHEGGTFLMPNPFDIGPCRLPAAIVMADPLEPCRVLVRIAGGALPGMSFEAFLKQASAYEDEDDLFSRHSRFRVELSLTHPIAVRRVEELMLWVQSGEYDRIIDGSHPRRGAEPPPSVEFDAAVAHYRERFSAFLDRTTGSAQDLAKQFGEWLRRPTATDDD
ncbi:MAG: hypothetical protein ABSF84_05980 [Acidimicrobiales bacterium]